jgi:hypothetical protein
MNRGKEQGRQRVMDNDATNGDDWRRSPSVTNARRTRIQQFNRESIVWARTFNPQQVAQRHRAFGIPLMHWSPAIQRQGGPDNH